MIACPSCKLVCPDGAAYCQYCGAAMRPPLMVPRPAPPAPVTEDGSHRKQPIIHEARRPKRELTAPPKLSREAKLIWAGIGVVLIVLLVVGVAFSSHSSTSTSNTSSSSGGSSIEWEGAENQLYDPVNTHDAAVKAGDYQGAASARTTIIKHCEDYASLPAGGGQAETNVRAICAQAGQPIP